MAMSAEQKKAQSERMKQQWAEKKAKIAKESEKDNELPTVEKATEIVEQVDAEQGNELSTVDEMSEVLDPESGNQEDISEEQPENVTYWAINRNFKLTLPDKRRGKTLVDGTKVMDRSIQFMEFRYETQSMDERIGIEKSNSFLTGRVGIFTPKVKRLFPDVPIRERKRPNEKYFEKVMNITPSSTAPVGDAVNRWD